MKNHKTLKEMKKIVKQFMMLMAVTTLSLGMASCGDDNEDNGGSSNGSTNSSTKETELAAVNTNYVDNTIVATYKKLANDCEQLLRLSENINSQESVNAICEQWKVARQDWELSEAFLFGAASGYGIDPHIDTWPFDVISFTKTMAKFDPSVSEEDAATVAHLIATTQNFTGFHAMEYVIFRDGKERNFADLDADDKFFVKAVAADLYLSACRLEVAWAGTAADKEHVALLEEAELMPDDDFGTEFRNAGQRGSRWASALDASVQIIDGCIDIIGEVADSKIGSAYTGDDVTYIESPHAYNSIQDFYDNIRGVKQALYGGLTTIDATVPAKNSIMEYCQTNYPTEAKAAMTALENALSTINKMKRPFVLNYSDPTAGAAIESLHALDEALSALKVKLDPNQTTK